MGAALFQVISSCSGKRGENPQSPFFPRPFLYSLKALISLRNVWDLWNVCARWCRRESGSLQCVSIHFVKKCTLLRFHFAVSHWSLKHHQHLATRFKPSDRRLLAREFLWNFTVTSIATIPEKTIGAFHVYNYFFFLRKIVLFGFLTSCRFYYNVSFICRRIFVSYFYCVTDKLAGVALNQKKKYIINIFQRVRIVSFSREFYRFDYWSLCCLLFFLYFVVTKLYFPHSCYLLS